KSYLDWLGEKRDWPVGRQLWWGHRIPVWHVRYGHVQSTDSGRSIWADDEIRASLEQWFRDRRIENEIATRESQNTSLVCTANMRADGEFVCIESILKDYDREADREYAEQTPSGMHLLQSCEIDRDEEVLDTWFSSALWPFSTMGWPEATDELKAFYPTSCLVTSRDIITLWVARMVLMGKYLNPLGDADKAVPFPEVYIHPKILDGFGETMSKSKGNGVDPLDVIDQFGADALRFGIAYLTTETQDVRMPVEFVCPTCDATIPQTKKNRVLPRVDCPSCSAPFRTQWAEKEEDLALPRGAVTSERFELGRNFCNKLWNASRFALTNLQGYEPAAVALGDLKIEDRWLLSRLATVTGEVSKALDDYRFADAARAIYDFAWNEFCSFYLE
ncbi:MAG: class I tRNA ligase family protein, partial [Planctomycetota bacterium]